MEIKVERRKIVIGLSFMVILLSLAHFTIVVVIQNVFEFNDRFKLFRYFDLGMEKNFPTYFSTMILLICSFILLIIYISTKKNGGYFKYQWIALSCIFLFLSIDEFVSLHERLIRPMRRLIGIGEHSWFHWAWVIPYEIFVLALLVFYLKFILHLTPKVRIRCVLAAALFVSGAIGLEILGGYYHSIAGLGSHTNDATYSALQLVEETLEMSGIVVFINALLLHLETRFTHLSLGFSTETA